MAAPLGSYLSGGSGRMAKIFLYSLATAACMDAIKAHTHVAQYVVRSTWLFSWGQFVIHLLYACWVGYRRFAIGVAGFLARYFWHFSQLYPRDVL